ncbi:hypothetical protein AAMO2058_001418300 [Amorphochlora amoebiformis]|uniref:Pentacotripeptide-repeat region of PRORP domain-containing protein n=1 Tax=Amorphochlora amoebiformis TaxID=1561963 RepID=A0A7S0D773_9EUKA|mmetsp:Transcript_20572/g.32614  ORF Transcript_20572/g.32614 Transcript_20572/m.32614 type:complete len:374 (+) Transcript_20572:44-1165(+)
MRTAPRMVIGLLALWVAMLYKSGVHQNIGHSKSLKARLRALDHRAICAKGMSDVKEMVETGEKILVDSRLDKETLKNVADTLAKAVRISNQSRVLTDNNDIEAFIKDEEILLKPKSIEAYEKQLSSLKREDLNSTLRVYDEVTSRVSEDTLTSNMLDYLLYAHMNAHNGSGAEYYFQKFYNSDDIEPSAKHLSLVCGAYAQALNERKATIFHQMILQNKLSPLPLLYGAMIRMFCHPSIDNLDKALEWMKISKNQGIHMQHWGQYIVGLYIRRGQYEEAKKLSAECIRNARFYARILQSFPNKPNPTLFEPWLSMLEQDSIDPNPKLIRVLKDMTQKGLVTPEVCASLVSSHAPSRSRSRSRVPGGGTGGVRR